MYNRGKELMFLFGGEYMRYINNEDVQIASRFLFISIAITGINQDIEKVNNNPFKIKDPYLELLHAMISSAKKERKTLRKRMQDRRIQVTRLNQTDSFATYLFISNRSEEIKSYFIPVIRKKVTWILEELMMGSLRQYCPSSAFDSYALPLNSGIELSVALDSSWSHKIHE